MNPQGSSLMVGAEEAIGPSVMILPPTWRQKLIQNCCFLKTEWSLA